MASTAAAAVTAGMSMAGLRATNFSSGQGIAYMHESLYAAVGKRLTYVLNVAARAMTKHALNVHAGHDDYHAVGRHRVLPALRQGRPGVRRPPTSSRTASRNSRSTPASSRRTDSSRAM